MPMGEVGAWVQRALVRLHLWFTGETHRVLAEYGREVRGLLLDKADADGAVDVIGGFGVVTEAAERWGAVFAEWVDGFERARRDAVMLALGGVARMHMGMMGEGEILDIGDWGLERVESVGVGRYGGVGGGGGGVGVGEDGGVGEGPVFEPQLQAVLDAANRRVYSDGFELSQRIWRLERDSLEGIRRTLLSGVANGDSAWNVAKELEGLLGANAECPRWTSTRLYKLTPTERVTSRKGLYSSTRDTPCASVGVAYNALRMARNEIQIAHQMATDEAWGKVPWIEKEKVNLSPDHPPIGCECEDVVVGGDEGDGVYAKGEISLPIHVQCLCYKTAELMKVEEFVGRLRGWVTRTEPWPEMDGYADYVGVGVDDPRLLEPGLLVGWGATLVKWLWSAN